MGDEFVSKLTPVSDHDYSFRSFDFGANNTYEKHFITSLNKVSIKSFTYKNCTVSQTVQFNKPYSTFFLRVSRQS